MLSYAALFLIIALVAALFGFGGIAASAARRTRGTSVSSRGSRRQFVKRAESRCNSSGAWGT